MAKNLFERKVLLSQKEDQSWGMSLNHQQHGQVEKTYMSIILKLLSVFIYQIEERKE